VKLLAVVQTYPPRMLGGAEIAADTLFRWLVARGHEVRVHLTDWPMDAYTRQGVEVVPLINFHDLAWADVVYTHLYPGIQKTAGLAHQAGRPLVYWAHAPAHFNLGYPLALLMANSEHLAAVHGGSVQCPTVVIRPPVFADEYRTSRENATCVTRIGLSEAKGGHVFWQLAWRMADHDFLGVQGGWGEQVVPPSPPANAVLWPNTPSIRDAYAATRVLVMPSDSHETYGRVGVEALASGIPVIAADLPGVREALAGAATYLPDRNDVDAWEEAIRSLDDADAYEAAAARALARSAELDPTADLDLAEASLLAVAGVGA
jgi:glycosyltransferase involved in cell wall biosynthesis